MHGETMKQLGMFLTHRPLCSLLGIGGVEFLGASYWKISTR